MTEGLFGKKWNLVLGSSRFSAEFRPERETRAYEEVPGGYKLTVTGTSAGQPYSWSYTALYDGKPHSVHGRKDVDSILAYKVDDHVTLGVFLKQGVRTGGYVRLVSLSGGELQVLAAGINEKGAPYFDVLTYKA
jgi:hypothetical protein